MAFYFCCWWIFFVCLSVCGKWWIKFTEAMYIKWAGIKEYFLVRIAFFFFPGYFVFCYFFPLLLLNFLK